MLKWAPLRHVLPAIFLLAGTLLAQTTESPQNQSRQSENEKQAVAQRQAAVALLDEVMSGVKSLGLPQNRIAIEAEAFPTLWSQNQSQGRALVLQMEGDFAQAASQQDQGTAFNLNLTQALRMQRQTLVQVIAQSDPELALSFLTASRPYVQAGSPEQEAIEERQLNLNLAVQQAAHNPRRALQTAEHELQNPGDLPFELVNLLDQVAANDARSGAQLFHEIVGRLKDSDLTSRGQNLNFALNLLSNEFSRAQQTSSANATNGNDAPLKSLAEALSTAALSPQFPQEMLPGLRATLPVLEQLASGKAEALREKLREYSRTLSPEQKSWEDFNQAQMSGDSSQLLAVAAQAPEGVRSGLYQQIAYRFVNEGDYQRARDLAGNVSDPMQRNQLLQLAARQAAWGASNKGDFAAARQLAEQITPAEDRATTLAQLALNAAGTQQKALAQQMLEEADAILANTVPGATAFSAQMQIAQAFIQLRSERALPLLEGAASRLELVLAAAAQVDGFLPFQRSFESGELLLTNNFLFGSLIQPYSEAAAALAIYNLPAARTLVDRLSLPEARLMAELLVARGVLNQAGTTGGYATLSIGVGLQR
jgi:hypothetical protein